MLTVPAYIINGLTALRELFRVQSESVHPLSFGALRNAVRHLEQHVRNWLMFAIADRLMRSALQHEGVSLKPAYAYVEIDDDDDDDDDIEVSDEAPAPNILPPMRVPKTQADLLLTLIKRLDRLTRLIENPERALANYLRMTKPEKSEDASDFDPGDYGPYSTGIFPDDEDDVVVEENPDDATLIDVDTS